MRFLVQFLTKWKSRSKEEQQRLAGEPWEVLELVDEIRTSTDGMQANALLHLLFPAEFESMVAGEQRQLLLAAFAETPGVAEADGEDRKIAAISKAADEALGRVIQLYEDPLHTVWAEGPTPEWEELLDWAQKLYEWSEFDSHEREYKLVLAEKVARARTALEEGDAEWLTKLRSAVRASQNNLTSWRAHESLLSWAEANPDVAGELLTKLWMKGAEDPTQAIAAFLTSFSDEAVSGPGTRLSIASFLLLGSNPTGAPIYRASVSRPLSRLLGRSSSARFEIDPEGAYRPPELASVLGVDAKRVRRFLRERYPREEEEYGQDWRLNAEQAEAVVARFQESEDSDSTAASYAAWVGILEEFRLRLLGRGVEIRDLLDAQGLAYWLTQAGPLEDWSEAEQEAFRRFQAQESSPPPSPARSRQVGAVELPGARSELAAETHLPQKWLGEQIEMLAEKRQVIFYGPPGTGKTFVALKLAEHLTSAGGEFRLIQFHPSYTYEDFFEGYRPQSGVGSDESRLEFALVPGPLRELAAEAAANPQLPFILIIDEINRGNVAKIFGELFFLLEYRDREIQLQYSREEQFRLPPNLFVIGTMNTADRSIALVDSALRRRFYFSGFLPTAEPVSLVLAKWLDANGLEPESASLLDALNEAIDDDDFAVGPSYLMTADGTAPNIERVWRHAIRPLLEEHYFGTGRDIEAEFGPAALRRRIAEQEDAPSEAAETDAPDG